MLYSFSCVQWSDSSSPKGIFTLICQTLSKASSFSSHLKAYAGSPLLSLVSLLSLHYCVLSALRSLHLFQGRLWHMATRLSFPFHCEDIVQYLHGCSHDPSIVAMDDKTCLNSSNIQGLSYVCGHTLIWLDFLLQLPTWAHSVFKVMQVSSPSGKPAACVSQQCWAQIFEMVLTVEANNTFFVLNNST